jgi:hypothetical protein
LSYRFLQQSFVPFIISRGICKSDTSHKTGCEIKILNRRTVDYGITDP